ncbi:MAG TPA: response regulator [Candidatus Omnitrophota bacterium]|nr:response regulator [Candidatus Omnitrophota bacterium]HPS36835.1 response regulator [Candidatus Omnitrophota bacterium]
MAKKILVIDDEPDILTMVAKRLDANRYTVVTAGSGEEGLAKAKQECPDLVFLDYIMPGMTGDEVLCRLKQDPETKKIPVIIFTAATKKMKVGEFQALGAAGCLFKPFTSDGLLGRIREVLGGEA